VTFVAADCSVLLHAIILKTSAKGEKERVTQTVETKLDRYPKRDSVPMAHRDARRDLQEGDNHQGVRQHMPIPVRRG
jgi:hypothetical protein